MAAADGFVAGRMMASRHDIDASLDRSIALMPAPDGLLAVVMSLRALAMIVSFVAVYSVGGQPNKALRPICGSSSSPVRSRSWRTSRSDGFRQAGALRSSFSPYRPSRHHAAGGSCPCRRSTACSDDRSRVPFGAHPCDDGRVGRPGAVRLSPTRPSEARWRASRGAMDAAQMRAAGTTPSHWRDRPARGRAPASEEVPWSRFSWSLLLAGGCPSGAPSPWLATARP